MSIPDRLIQSRRANLYLFIFFSVVTFALYYTSINNFFVLDDFVRLKAAQSGSLTENFHFFPVPLLAYRILYLVFGQSPVPLRILNYFLNALMCVLVFRFSLLMLNRFAEKAEQKAMISLSASFLFCIHYIHVETIVYYSELHEMFYSVFYLWGLICYLNYKSEKKKIYLYLVYLFFALCILSKETAVTFIAVVFLAEVFAFKSPVKSLVTLLYPLVLTAAAFVFTRYFFFPSLDVLNRPESIWSIGGEILKNYLFAFTAFIVSLDFVLIKDVYKAQNTNLLNTFNVLAAVYKTAIFGIAFSVILYILILRKSSKLKIILLSLAIITISSFAWLAGYERYLYLPSSAFCLLLTYWLFTELKVFNKKLIYVILCLTFTYNIYCLKLKEQQWINASNISKQTVEKIILATRGLPPGSKVYFKDVPGEYKSAWILRYGIHELPGLFLKREDISFYYIYQKNNMPGEPNVYVYDYPEDKLYKD